MSQTISKCAIAVAERDSKLEVFALQFYGECYSGYKGLGRYDMYGKVPYSDDNDDYCWSGVGKAGFNFVYKFKK